MVQVWLPSARDWIQLLVKWKPCCRCRTSMVIRLVHKNQIWEIATALCWILVLGPMLENVFCPERSPSLRTGLPIPFLNPAKMRFGRNFWLGVLLTQGQCKDFRDTPLDHICGAQVRGPTTVFTMGGGGGFQFEGERTYLDKSHFLTLVSTSPRTRNQHSVIAISKKVFLWNPLVVIQYRVISCLLTNQTISVLTTS